MAVIGSKTKIKSKAKTRSVVKSNDSPPIGASVNSGKKIKSNIMEPIGGSYKTNPKRIKSYASLPIGGSKKVSAPKGPRVKRKKK